eukprot:756014-Rhodomonas_salina.1
MAEVLMQIRECIHAYLANPDTGLPKYEVEMPRPTLMHRNSATNEMNMVDWTPGVRAKKLARMHSAATEVG